MGACVEICVKACVEGWATCKSSISWLVELISCSFLNAFLSGL